MIEQGYTNVTYASESCAEQSVIDATIDKTIAFQKIMTMDESNPLERT